MTAESPPLTASAAAVALHVRLPGSDVLHVVTVPMESDVRLAEGYTLAHMQLVPALGALAQAMRADLAGREAYIDALVVALREATSEATTRDGTPRLRFASDAVAAVSSAFGYDEPGVAPEIRRRFEHTVSRSVNDLVRAHREGRSGEVDYALRTLPVALWLYGIMALGMDTTMAEARRRFDEAPGVPTLDGVDGGTLVPGGAPRLRVAAHVLALGMPEKITPSL